MAVLSELKRSRRGQRQMKIQRLNTCSTKKTKGCTEEKESSAFASNWEPNTCDARHCNNISSFSDAKKNLTESNSELILTTNEKAVKASDILK
mmetsp:Transcript_26289/g.30408  ORF Transcript_26289/g.30408 Transcript_26289/m.30408 type:complete len:93 (+) Transcript_26289:324-602(+)